MSTAGVEGVRRRRLVDNRPPPPLYADEPRPAVAGHRQPTRAIPALTAAVDEHLPGWARARLGLRSLPSEAQGLLEEAAHGIRRRARPERQGRFGSQASYQAAASEGCQRAGTRPSWRILEASARIRRRRPDAWARGTIEWRARSSRRSVRHRPFGRRPGQRRFHHFAGLLAQPAPEVRQLELGWRHPERCAVVEGGMEGGWGAWNLVKQRRLAL